VRANVSSTVFSSICQYYLFALVYCISTSLYTLFRYFSKVDLPKPCHWLQNTLNTYSPPRNTPQEVLDVWHTRLASRRIITTACQLGIYRRRKIEEWQRVRNKKNLIIIVT